MKLPSITRCAALAIAAGVTLAAQPSTARADEYYDDYDGYDGYDDYDPYDPYAASDDGIQIVVNLPNVVHVDVSPPDPYVEEIPIAPSASWIWVAGAWSWNGYQWTWVSGRWVAPRPGYVYVQPYYDVADSGCYYTSGYFVRAKRARTVRNYVRDYRTNYRHHRTNDRNRWSYPQTTHRAERRDMRERTIRTQPAVYRERNQRPRLRNVQPARSDRHYRSPTPSRRIDHGMRDHRAQRQSAQRDPKQQRREWRQRSNARHGGRSMRDHRRR